MADQGSAHINSRDITAEISQQKMFYIKSHQTRFPIQQQTDRDDIFVHSMLGDSADIELMNDKKRVKRFIIDSHQFKEGINYQDAIRLAKKQQKDIQTEKVKEFEKKEDKKKQFKIDIENDLNQSKSNLKEKIKEKERNSANEPEKEKDNDKYKHTTIDKRKDRSKTITFNDIKVSESPFKVYNEKDKKRKFVFIQTEKEQKDAKSDDKIRYIHSEEEQDDKSGIYEDKHKQKELKKRLKEEKHKRKKEKEKKRQHEDRKRQRKKQNKEERKKQGKDEIITQNKEKIA
ncbi:MAG: hypothetical protein EZS28_042062, partial [Streblomastix strix]